MRFRHTRFRGYASLTHNWLRLQSPIHTARCQIDTRFQGYALAESNLHIRCYTLARCQIDTHDFEVMLSLNPAYTSDVTPSQSLAHTILRLRSQSPTHSISRLPLQYLQCNALKVLWIVYFFCIRQYLKAVVWKFFLKEIIHQVLVGSDPFLGQFFHNKIEFEKINIFSKDNNFVWVKIKIIEPLFSCTKHFWYWYKNYLIKDEILSTCSWLEKFQVTSAHTPIGNC